MQDIDTQRDGKSLVAPWTHDVGRKPGNDMGIDMGIYMEI
jgi:hypothetical protein